MDSNEIKNKYHKNYDFMGVSPEELYLRQENKCHLELILDRIDNQDYFGEIVCTDGKDRAPTSCMLNPTFECVKCMSSFIEKVANTMLDIKKINSITFTIVSEINRAILKHGDNVEVCMCTSTLDNIDAHLNNTTLYLDERYKPIRVTSVGDIILFGSKIILDEHIKENNILIKPDGITVEVL